MDWTLILLVFMAGDPTPRGTVLGGFPTEQACIIRSKQDTPRVRHLHSNAEHWQWECVERQAPPVKPKVEPSV